MLKPAAVRFINHVPVESRKTTRSALPSPSKSKRVRAFGFGVGVGNGVGVGVGNGVGVGVGNGVAVGVGKGVGVGVGTGVGMAVGAGVGVGVGVIPVRQLLCALVNTLISFRENGQNVSTAPFRERRSLSCFRSLEQLGVVCTEVVSDLMCRDKIFTGAQLT